MQLMRRSWRSVRGQAGFSLAELLVAATVSLVALVCIGAFNRFQLFAIRDQAAQVDLQSGARSIADLFGREIRRAGMDPTCSKAFEAIATATTTQVRFKSDLNANGAIGGTDEDITYRFRLWREKIERTSGGVTDLLMSALDPAGSGLAYFDANGIQLIPGSGGLTSAQRAAVRRIRLSLAFKGDAVDPQNSQLQVTQVSADIDLRNRFFLGSTACP